VNERGLTLLELLIAAALGTVVLLGLGQFYLATVRFGSQSNAQTFLQRQAVIIMDEMAQQIRPATGLALATCGGVVNSLQVTSGGGTYCFYQSGTGLSETRPGGTWNLLSGSPVTLQANSATFTLPDAKTAAISFQLQATTQGGATQIMTFTTTIGRRN
jgi:Tfp pilus assembly protein PilV